MCQKPATSARLFISYSHADVRWLERLQFHLKPLETAGILDRWDDTRILAGGQWREEIRDALGEAQVAILLVSPRFLASDFIMQEELPPLLDNAEKQGTLILPILLAPSRFDRTPSISKFQAARLPGRGLEPLIGMTEHDQEALLLQIANTVEDAIKDRTSKSQNGTIAPLQEPTALPAQQRAETLSQEVDSTLMRLMTLAKEGDADAQYSLAETYELGNTVSQDSGEAARWYQYAAQQGHVRAQTKLGLMYSKGQGGGPESRRSR